MSERINYHGWPVSAHVVHKVTGERGQIEHPYTKAGEDIINSGKVLVSNMSPQGVNPNHLKPRDAAEIKEHEAKHWKRK